MRTKNFQMFKLALEKAEEPEIKFSTYHKRKGSTQLSPTKLSSVKEVVLYYTEQRASLNLEAYKPFKIAKPVCEVNRSKQFTCS